MRIFKINLFLFTILCAQMEWTQATSSAGWCSRANHAGVVFNNKLWVMGGYTAILQFHNDVWYSEDGVNWTCATPSAGWSRRSHLAAVVFDNKIWVLGGLYVDYPNVYHYNDVWYSSDGVNWTRATPAAGWSPRCNLAAVVFDNKIWVMGGNKDHIHYNDVWYSSDGIQWTQATASAPWGARSGHAVVVFDGKMYVIGGAYEYNDVWHSTDGVNWVRDTSSAPWPARYNHSAVAWQDKIWVMGGRLISGPFYNDVWYSTDGKNWFLADTAADWAARESPCAQVFNNKLWIMGGFTSSGGIGSYLNDVWYTRGLTEVKENRLSFPKRRFNLFPNPFKNKLEIHYTLITPTYISLKVYDNLGKLVRILVKKRMHSSGEYLIRWDGKDAYRKTLPPGVYLLQLESNGMKETLRVIKNK